MTGVQGGGQGSESEFYTESSGWRSNGNVIDEILGEQWPPRACVVSHNRPVTDDGGALLAAEWSWTRAFDGFELSCSCNTIFV